MIQQMDDLMYSYMYAMQKWLKQINSKYCYLKGDDNVEQHYLKCKKRE